MPVSPLCRRNRLFGVPRGRGYYLLSKNHLFTTPERIVEFHTIMNRSNHIHSGIVNAIATVYFVVQIEGVAKSIVDLVDVAV